VLKAALARWHQGYRTAPFPPADDIVSDRFRGQPRLDAARCEEGCATCIDACPVEALATSPQGLSLDLGRCIFCTECTAACPSGAIEYTTDYRLAVRERADLVLEGDALKLAGALDAASRRLFGRSLKLRQVSAGGCNGCEADVNVLNTVVFDLGRFGIQFVASPRHADGLLITGPVTENMRLALEKTYAAVPAPKLVVAVGACAIAGGPFAGHAEVMGGADKVVPVDLYVPGCPPHPLTILDGLLRLLGKLGDELEPPRGAPGLRSEKAELDTGRKGSGP
jgi:Ni,Fe-hydrogenase III small subunit/formate hydrogenlyase subunit 6/NADH:ubiquinone oxidoreductase subunit I